jgi:hypothetical protein
MEEEIFKEGVSYPYFQKYLNNLLALFLTECFYTGSIFENMLLFCSEKKIRENFKSKSEALRELFI